MRQARDTASDKSKSVTMVFTPAIDTYSISNLTDLNRSSAAYTVELSQSPYDSNLISASLGSDTEIHFDHFGQADSGGTITVESGGYQEPVTINSETGKATIP